MVRRLEALELSRPVEDTDRVERLRPVDPVELVEHVDCLHQIGEIHALSLEAGAGRRSVTAQSGP
jgi:hypothetical protein